MTSVHCLTMPDISGKPQYLPDDVMMTSCKIVALNLTRIARCLPTQVTAPYRLGDPIWPMGRTIASFDLRAHSRAAVRHCATA
jgi:hypothetical protein